jgi:hypothetical protein
VSSWLVATDVMAHPSTVGLGNWLIAKTPADAPYPCACDQLDDDPPAWLVEAARRAGRSREQIPKCRPYLAQKGKRAGRWWSYCDCWGRRRDDALPEHCCAWHEHNPAYDITGALGIAAVAQRPVSIYAASGLPEADDGLDAEERIVHDWETGLAPYVRRFTAAQITCPCATPWDGITDARKVGYHCPACCHNFVNWGRAQAHQKYATMVCKDPATQLNIDGVPVYRAARLGGHIVWN